MTVRLLSVCELRRSCVEEMVALGVPQRGNPQTKSSEVILREQRRRRQEGLQTHLKALMDCSCGDPPPRLINTPSMCPHQLSLPLLTRRCRGAEPVWTALDLKKEAEASSSSSPAIPPSPLTASETRLTRSASCVSAGLFLRQSPRRHSPQPESPALCALPTIWPSRTRSSRPSVWPGFHPFPAPSN